MIWNFIMKMKQKLHIIKLRGKYSSRYKTKISLKRKLFPTLIKCSLNFRCYYIALSFMAAQKWAESMALFQRVVVYANKAKNDKLLEGKIVQ